MFDIPNDVLLGKIPATLGYVGGKEIKVRPLCQEAADLWIATHRDPALASEARVNELRKDDDATPDAISLAMAEYHQSVMDAVANYDPALESVYTPRTATTAQAVIAFMILNTITDPTSVTVLLSARLLEAQSAALARAAGMTTGRS